MNIRKATINDLDSIFHIEMVCFPNKEAASKNNFKKRLEYYSNHFLVLENKNKIIGFINGLVSDNKDLTDDMYDNATMHNENGKWQMIFGLDVIPEYRRQGLAQKLIDEFIKMAKFENRLGIVLTCKNELVHCYSKFGFINEGISV